MLVDLVLVGLVWCIVCKASLPEERDLRNLQKTAILFCLSGLVRTRTLEDFSRAFISLILPILKKRHEERMTRMRERPLGRFLTELRLVCEVGNAFI
jgi:hypothetical protein